MAVAAAAGAPAVAVAAVALVPAATVAAGGSNLCRPSTDGRYIV